jgi:hypothetical protein
LRYPKIGHLPGSRTGPSDRNVGETLATRLTSRGAPGDRVLVEEKLDGSCVAVTREKGRIRAVGREGRDCAQSKNLGRRRFAEWVAAQDFAFLGEGERLCGEWLALAHGTRYRLPHGPFVVFDRFTGGGERLPREEIECGDLPQPTLLHDGGPLLVEDALALLGEHGHHGAIDSAEGVVYRLERGGQLIAIAKFVRAGKIDGRYLPDHSGGEAIWNSWI